MKTHSKRILNFYCLNCRNCNKPMNIADNYNKSDLCKKHENEKERDFFDQKKEKKKKKKKKKREINEHAM